VGQQQWKYNMSTYQIDAPAGATHVDGGLITSWRAQNRVAAQGAWQLFATVNRLFLEALAAYRARAAIREMERLEDYMLRDIGIRREAIKHAVCYGRENQARGFTYDWPSCQATEHQRLRIALVAAISFAAATVAGSAVGAPEIASPPAMEMSSPASEILPPLPEMSPAETATSSPAPESTLAAANAVDSGPTAAMDAAAPGRPPRAERAGTAMPKPSRRAVALEAARSEPAALPARRAHSSCTSGLCRSRFIILGVGY